MKSPAYEMRRMNPALWVGLADSLQDDDWQLSSGFALEVEEVGAAGGVLSEEAGALWLWGYGGAGLVGVAAELDGYLRVGEEVVVPGGVGGGSAVRGDDDDAVAVGAVAHGGAARFAALCAGGGEDQERHGVEWWIQFATVGAEFGDSSRVKGPGVTCGGHGVSPVGPLRVDAR